MAAVGGWVGLTRLGINVTIRRDDSETATVELSPNGRILIPLALRRALGVKPGDKLVLEVEDGTMRVSTRLARLREVQALARTFLAGQPSLVDELEAERRAESARE